MSDGAVFAWCAFFTFGFIAFCVWMCNHPIAVGETKAIRDHVVAVRVDETHWMVVDARDSKINVYYESGALAPTVEAK